MIPERQHDDCHAICPYCGEIDFQPEAENYSDTASEEQCQNCDKKYHLFQSFEVIHYTHPDCELNGEAHSYTKDMVGHKYCDVCGNPNNPKSSR